MITVTGKYKGKDTTVHWSDGMVIAPDDFSDELDALFTQPFHDLSSLIEIRLPSRRDETESGYLIESMFELLSTSGFNLGEWQENDLVKAEPLDLRGVNTSSQLVKHLPGQHDQSTHGNWARGGSSDDDSFAFISTTPGLDGGPGRVQGYVKGEPVAAILFNQSGYQDEERGWIVTIKVSDILVRAEHRRQGLATKMWAALTERYQNDDFTEITPSTSFTSEGSKLWESLTGEKVSRNIFQTGPTEIEKGDEHDQKTHGNWARGSVGELVIRDNSTAEFHGEDEIVGDDIAGLREFQAWFEDDDDVPIGGFLIYYPATPENRKYGETWAVHIVTLHVEESRRGQGIATALMDKLQEKYKGQEIHHSGRTPAGKAFWESYIADHPLAKRGGLPPNFGDGRKRRAELVSRLKARRQYGPPVRGGKKKKKKKRTRLGGNLLRGRSATTLGGMSTRRLAKHAGPGKHPGTGTSQKVHGGDGAGDSTLKTWRLMRFDRSASTPSDPDFAELGYGDFPRTKLVRLPYTVEAATEKEAQAMFRREFKSKFGGNSPPNAIEEVSESIAKHPEGVEIHPGTGTTQAVHGGGGGDARPAGVAVTGHTTAGKANPIAVGIRDGNAMDPNLTVDTAHNDKFRSAWNSLPELPDRTYWVRPHNVDNFSQEVARLNRRGQRYFEISEGEGLNLVELDRTHTYTWIDGTTVPFIAVQITGQEPNVPGFDFLAKIEHLQNEDGTYTNILKTAPQFQGVEGAIPERYRDAGPDCDICNRKIYRKETFLVRNQETGEIVQAGRDDLASYTGFNEADQFANYTSSYADLVSRLESRPDDDFFGDRGAGGAITHDAVTALAITASITRLEGFIPSSAEGTTTKETLNLLLNSRRLDDEGLRRLLPEDQDYEKAEKVQAWLSSLEGDDLANDYLWNLKVAATNPYGVDERQYGLIASAVSAYDREQGAIVERARRVNIDALSEYVGEVKVRQDFPDLSITRVNSFEGNFGTVHVYNFLDPNDNVLVWFASTKLDADTGDTISLKATVKAHEVDTYEGRNRKQTIITRGKRIE